MAEIIPMIALSPTMEIGTIMKWHVNEGDSIASGDLLCEVETDKATMDYESVYDGTLLKILIPEGQKAELDMPIAVVGKPDEDVQPMLEQAVKALPPAKDESPASAERIKVSPLAAKIAGQQGIDLGAVKGSGPGGRIVKRDLKATNQTAPARPGEVAEDKIVPVSPKRAVIAKRLSESKFNAPHYYLKFRVNMEAIVKAREAFNQSHPTKVSLNAVLIKIAAETLKRHPAVNASWQGDRIIQYGRADIGLAVARDDGLIVPVVRRAGDKSIFEIENDLKTLIEKARTGRLQPEDYSNATFTVSNLGAFGTDAFTAVINPPGSAILAVGAVHQSPVVDSRGQIRAAAIAKLTLSCDHRVIDGIVGAKFMQDLKQAMELPLLLMVGSHNGK